MAKKMIGIVLALCLIVCLLPVMALAEEAAPTATLTVTTGTNEAPIVWAPALSAGMAPAYAKTTAEGALVLTGATEADFNLKAEWPTGGKPTLTLKNATLANNTFELDTGDAANVKHTIAIAGTADFEILVKGTNVINGRHDTKPQNIHYRFAPAGIQALNYGSVTIKGDSKADIFTIDNYVGAMIQKYYNALTIENITFNGYVHNTNTKTQCAIYMKAPEAQYFDKTDLTIRNANFTLEDLENKYHGNLFIVMGGTSNWVFNAENTSKVLFQNSTVRLWRNNGSSTTQASGSTIQAVNVTIDRCDLLAYSRHVSFRYWPEVINCNIVTAGDLGTLMPPGTSAGQVLPKLEVTHICTGPADDGDCTTAEKCVVCDKAMSTVQTAHTPAADDGDCTTAITCTNPGCKVVLTPAAAAHVAAADDGDCTTAVTCTNAGCKHVVVAAKESHTSPADRPSCDVAANCTVCGKTIPAGQHTGGTATCTAKAKCTTCGKEYGELAAHTGGTATCKDKAVCTVCKQAYGELSTTHTPAADDGDCTTAIKCSVCGKETTAAKTAHTFANDKDASCDNAGCKHTRTLTTNPSTGDISILLTAAVALTSAVGFAGVSVLRKKEN